MFDKQQIKYEKISNFSEDSSSDIDSIQSKYEKDRPTLKKELISEDVKLKRNVGVADGVSIVVGSMIGSGIFIVPTGVLQYCNGDVLFSMFVWVIGGIISFLIALCFCELATLIPQSGGMAPFLKAIYGDGMCFVFLWIYLIAACPQSTAVQIIALGDYISQSIAVGLKLCPDGLSPTLSKLIGFSFALLILACNMTNVKLAVKLQFWCTSGKVAALIIISVAGMWMIFIDYSTLVSNFHHSQVSSSVVANLTDYSVSNTFWASLQSAPGLPGLSLAVFQALWAYDGFDNITCITEEVKDPRKVLPKIIICSIAAVVGLYLIVNLSYFAVLTKEEMLNSDAVAVSFAAKVHPWLAYIVTGGVCLSLIGSINIAFLAAGRMPFVAGRMGFMPEVLSMIHVRYYSPYPALLFLTALVAIMTLPSNIDMLLKGVVFTLWAYRALCSIGVFILRRTMKDAQRPYKVHKITAFLASCVGVYIVIIPLVFNPQILYIITFMLVAVFGFFYWLIKKNYLTITGVGKYSIFFQKLLNVLPSPTSKFG